MGNQAATVTLVSQLLTLTFNNGVADSLGTRWFVTIEGWESGPTKIYEDDSGAVDGTSFAGGFLGKKEMVLRGSLVATDYDNVKASIDRLELALGRPDLLAVLTQNDASPAAPRFADIHRGEARARWAYAGNVEADFEVDVVAPAGIRESVTAQSLSLTGGAGTAINIGNADAWPWLQVVGPAAGPVVLHDSRHNRTLTVTGSLAGGQTLLVTTKPKGVFVNGVSDFARRDPSSEWPFLENGNNPFTYSGGGTATLWWHHTWR